MRIGLLQTQVPFVHGGAERHSAGLRAALERHGHEVAEITIPFRWYPAEKLVDHTLAAKLIDASEASGVPIDLAVGLRFPAYLAQHPRKTFWLIHQYRQAYDMWDAGTSDLLDDPLGQEARQMVISEDRLAFADTQAPIFANSKNVAERVKQYLGMTAQPLYHPPIGAEHFYTERFGDFLLAPGRINPSKRIDLMLRALAQSREPGTLCVAGSPEDPSYLARLQDLARSLGVDDRLSWRIGVSDTEMRDLYACARGVVFVPQDEDYGYITLEAMLSAKPVITCHDAGGPLEFISDRREGFVTEPTPAALARAFDEILSDKTLAERIGRRGRKRIERENISWDHVVEVLTGAKALKQVQEEVPVSAAPGFSAETSGAAPVRQLATAVAPAIPRTLLPFESAGDVMTAYAFDTLPSEASEPDPGLVSYLDTHWARYRATLDLITNRKPVDILDVGVFPPLVFEAMIATALPTARLYGVWEGPNRFEQTVQARQPALRDFTLQLAPANVERDRLPFDDASMDMVLAMEILEHFALDPYFFFCEVARVLRPEGHLVVTTPNVTSHRGVWKALNGVAPYSFGIFVPSGGVYGRHNREYTPLEVEQLGISAGFATDTLETRDVYDTHIEPEVAALLQSRGDRLALRGENILYVGRKSEKLQPPPPLLYHGDPWRMAGRLEEVETEQQTGLVRVRVRNTSQAWWTLHDERATLLLAQWSDASGILRHVGVFLSLPEALGPGQASDVRLRLDAAGCLDARGQLTLDLFQKGVGTMTGTGRANQLSLPCSEDAFLRLAQASRGS